MALELSKCVPTIQVPFAFSRPSFLHVPSIRRAGFIGEVDISGNCFQNFGPRIAKLAKTSSAEHSEEIVEAKVNIDQVFHCPPDEISSDVNLLTAWKWNVNNWIRWRLITSLIKITRAKLICAGMIGSSLGMLQRRVDLNLFFVGMRISEMRSP